MSLKSHVQAHFVFVPVTTHPIWYKSQEELHATLQTLCYASPCTFALAYLASSVKSQQGDMTPHVRYTGISAERAWLFKVYSPGSTVVAPIHEQSEGKPLQSSLCLTLCGFVRLVACRNLSSCERAHGYAVNLHLPPMCSSAVIKVDALFSHFCIPMGICMSCESVCVSAGERF